MKITDTGAPSAPPPSAASGPSGKQQRAGSSFDALLALQSQARTATAEGPKKTSERREPAARPDGAAPRPAADKTKTDAEPQRVGDREQGPAELPQVATVVDAPEAPLAAGTEAPTEQAQTVVAEAAAASQPQEVAMVPVAPTVAATETPDARPLAAASDADAPVPPTATAVAPITDDAVDAELADVPATGPADREGRRSSLPSALAGLADKRADTGGPLPTAPAAPAAPVTAAPTAEAAPVADVPVAADSAAPAAAPVPPAAAPKAPGDGAAAQHRAADQPKAQGIDQPKAQGMDQPKDQRPEHRLPEHASARAVEVHAAKAAGERPGPNHDAAAAPAAASTPEVPAAPANTTPFVAPLHTEHVRGGLQLAATVERLRELVQVAARNGAAHARLQLHPAELGGIEVRLKSAADGVTARIMAERPEAVQALQQAGAELRQSLEDRGVTVLDVEVSLAASAGDSSAHDAAAQARSSQDGLFSDTTTNRRGRDAASDSTSEPDELPQLERAPRADAGAVLVDVLA